MYKILYNMYFNKFMKENRKEVIEHWVKVSADNLQRCSCSACGNRRKFSKGKEKLTRQERRMLESDNSFE